jgi:hypothetical protein
MAGILKPTTSSQQKPAPIAASLSSPLKDTSKRTTLASAGAALAKRDASTISKAQTPNSFHDPYLPMPRLPRHISDSDSLTTRSISVGLQEPAKKETAKKEAAAYEFESEEDLSAIGGSLQQSSKVTSRAEIDEFIGQKASMSSVTRVKNIGAASVQTSFGAGFAARHKFMASKLPAPAKESDAETVTATAVASAAMSKDSARGERAKESPLRNVFALSHSASPSASKTDDKSTKSPSPTNPSLEPAYAVSGLKYKPSSRSSQFARPAPVAAKPVSAAMPADFEIENDSDGERSSSPSVVVVVEAPKPQSKEPARETPRSIPDETFARLKAPSLEDTSLELPHTPPRPKYQPSPLSAQFAGTAPVTVKPALAAASAEAQIDAEIENDSDDDRTSSPSVDAVIETLELESEEPVARKAPIYIPGDNVDILIINDD